MAKQEDKEAAIKPINTSKGATYSVKKAAPSQVQSVPVRLVGPTKFLDFTKSGYFYLQLFGTMTQAEKEEFIRQNADTLSDFELIALDLLDHTKAGDKDAMQIFWGAQREVFKNANVADQLKQMAAEKNMASDSDFMQAIKDFADDIMEANVVSEKLGGNKNDDQQDH